MQSFILPDFYVPWPARQNPNLEAARIHSKAWARAMGILHTGQDDSPQVWDDENFDKHDYPLLCAYIHPETPIPELNLMTDWNVWAFYVDDYFLQVYKQSKDYKGAKEYLDRVLVFMPIDLALLPVPTNPTERALADLWLRTAPSKSEAWRHRIVEDTRNLLDAFLWELDNLSQQRLANPIEYIEMRRQVGAALWSADLVEHAMFVEIPERIAATRPIQVLKDTFADAVHLRNDIFSYDREVVKQGELTNAVLVMERFLTSDTQYAVNRVNDLLTSRLQQFEQTVLTELVPLFEEYNIEPLEQAHVLNYIRGLQDWQSGAHEWHIQTSRYLNPRAEQNSPSGGLIPSSGISATRMTPDSLGLQRFKKYAHISHQTVSPICLPKFYMPFTCQMNPCLDATRRDTKEWARQMGMLDELNDRPNVFIWDDRTFDAADVAFFCALFHPTATLSQLNVDAGWMTWGTYTDDYFLMLYEQTHDMAGAKACYARLLEFMPIDGVSLASVPLTPVERGLADLWVRTTKTLPVDKLPIFRKLIENLLEGFLWKLFNQIQNCIPDPIDYVETRRKTSGSELIIVLPRLAAYEQNVPPEVYRTHIMQELCNAVMDYTGLSNDIFSYQKEIEFEGGLNNGVLVIQNFLGCDQIQALEIVNKLMTERMKQFEHIEMKELPILFERFNFNAQASSELLNYVKELKNFMCATLQWHANVDRYREFEFRRSARPFWGTLNGFGTAAAHVKAAAANKMVETERGEAPKDAKTFANSHLNLLFMNPKEEAQAD